MDGLRTTCASTDMAFTQQQGDQLLLDQQEQHEHEHEQLSQERQEHLLQKQWLQQQVQDHQEQQQQQQQQWEELQQEDEGQEQQQQQGAMLPRSTNETLGSLQANVFIYRLKHCQPGKRPGCTIKKCKEEEGETHEDEGKEEGGADGGRRDPLKPVAADHTDEAQEEIWRC